VLPLNEEGGLPTRNWSSGVFEAAEAISGERMAETVLKGNGTCFGCIVRCKRVVEILEGPYRVDPRYGGPEYETLAAMGSLLRRVGSPSRVPREPALQTCMEWTPSAVGRQSQWAMSCFERGLLTRRTQGGSTSGLECRCDGTDG